MANNIETLKKYVIDVEVSTQKATAELDKLQKKVDKSVNSGQIKKDTQASINQIEGMIKELSGSIAKESEAIKNGLKNGLSGIKTKDLEDKFAAVNRSINGVIDKINLLSSTLNNSDFAKFERFVDAFTVPLQDLNKTVSELNTTLTALTEPLQTISKMKVGAIDTKAFEQSIKELKPITEKAKNELIRVFDNLSEEIQTSLLEDGKFIDFKDLDNDIAAGLKQQITSALDLLGKSSQKYSFNVGDIFSEAGLSFDESTLKTIAKKLDQQIKEALPEGKGRNRKQSGISTSTTLQLKPTAELSDEDVNKFIEELSTKIESKVQSKLSEKVGVKIPIKPDTVGLKKLVEQAIREYNKTAIDDVNAKVDIPINISIDEKSLSLVRSKIQNQIIEGGGIGIGGTTNIGDIGGIATESTLAQIRDILSKGITVAVGSMDGNIIQSIRTDNKEEETLLRNYNYLLNHKQVIPGDQESKSKAEAQYNLSKDAEKYYKQLIDSFDSFFKGYYKDKNATTPIDKLQKSDLYNATVGENGKYAKYGKGLNLEEHQKALKDVVENTYEAIKGEVDIVKEKYQKLRSSSLTKESKQLATEELEREKEDALSNSRIANFKKNHLEEIKKARDEQLKLDKEEIEQLEKEEKLSTVKIASLRKKINDAKTQKTKDRNQTLLDEQIKQQTQNANRLEYLRSGANYSENKIIENLIKNSYDKIISQVQSSSKMTDDIQKFLDTAAQRAIGEIVARYTKDKNFSLLVSKNVARNSKNAAKESISAGNGNKTVGKTLEQEILGSFTTATRSKLDKANTKELLGYIMGGANGVFGASFDKAGNIVNSMATNADKANAVSQMMKRIDDEAASAAQNYERQKTALEQIKSLQEDKTKDNAEEIQKIQKEHEDITKLLSDSSGIDEAISTLDKLYRSFISRFNSAKKELATSVFSEIDSESKYNKVVAEYQKKQKDLSTLSALDSYGIGFTPNLKSYYESLKKVVPELRGQLKLYEDINNVENGIVHAEEKRISESKEISKEMSEQTKFLRYDFSKEGNAAYSRTANLGGATKDIIRQNFAGMSVEELQNIYKDLILTNDEMTKSLEKYGDMEKLVSERTKKEVTDIIKFLENQKKEYEDLIKIRTAEFKERGAQYDPSYYQKQIEKIQSDINYYKSGTGRDNKELLTKREELEKLITLIDEYQAKDGFTGKENEYLDMLDKRKRLEESVNYLSFRYENEKGEALSYEETIRKNIAKESEKERDSIQDILKTRITLCELAKEELSYRKDISSVDIKARHNEAQAINNKLGGLKAATTKDEKLISEIYDQQFRSRIEQAESDIKKYIRDIENLRAIMVNGVTDKRVKKEKIAQDNLSSAKEQLKTIKQEFESTVKDLRERIANRQLTIDSLTERKKQLSIKESPNISVIKSKSDEIAAAEAAKAKAKAEFESKTYEEQIAELEKQIAKSSGEEKTHLQTKLGAIKQQYVAELNLLEAQEKQKEAVKETTFEKEKAAKQAEKALSAGTITSANGTITGNVALGDIATETTLQKVLGVLSGGKASTTSSDSKKDEVEKTEKSSSASKKNSQSKKEEADATEKASKATKDLGVSLKTIQDKIDKSKKPDKLNDNNYRKRLNAIGKSGSGLSSEAIDALAKEGASNGFVVQQRGNKLRFQQPWTNKQITDEDIALTNKYRDAEDQLTRAIIENEKAANKAARASRNVSQADVEETKTTKAKTRAINEENVATEKKSKKNKGLSAEEALARTTVNKIDKSALVDEEKWAKAEAAIVLHGEELAQKYIDSPKKFKKENYDAWVDFAEAGVKATKQALGISSPSKVFEQLGLWSAEGYKKGLLENLKDLKKYIIDALKNGVVTKDQIGELINWDGRDDSGITGKINSSMIGDLRRTETKNILSNINQASVIDPAIIKGIEADQKSYNKSVEYTNQLVRDWNRDLELIYKKFRDSDIFGNEKIAAKLAELRTNISNLQNTASSHDQIDRIKTSFEEIAYEISKASKELKEFDKTEKESAGILNTILDIKDHGLSSNASKQQAESEKERLEAIEKYNLELDEEEARREKIIKEAEEQNKIDQANYKLLRDWLAAKDAHYGNNQGVTYGKIDVYSEQAAKADEEVALKKELLELDQREANYLETRNRLLAEGKQQQIEFNNLLKGFNSTQKTLDNMSSSAFLNNKIEPYKEQVIELRKEWDNLLKNWRGNGTDDQKQRLQELIDKISLLKATASQYKDTMGKMSFVDIKPGQIDDVYKLRDAMAEYAEKQGYSNVVFQKFDKNQNHLVMSAKNVSGELIQLAGAYNKVNNSMYVGQPIMKQSISFWNSMSASLKQAFSTFGYYLGFAALIRKTMQEFRQGIQTLKEFDSALTTISYTMDLSQEQLRNLGLSALDMAEDLSMSMENALKIYQIYANMQTTAKEIEEVAKPTAILSNLSGVDASTAADQVQGILQQFNMLKDGEQDVAEISMHVVDVLDKISANVAVDYSKGIGIISEAVTATGQVAHDAGMSFEELAAITAKVAERTREDGSTIGNAMKTMFTRISKVSKMPQYADEVDNEQISKAAKALHDIGIEVYNSNGEFNNITDTLTQLNAKWKDLTDVEQSNIAFQIAATRQSAKFKSMLEAWTGAMSLAAEATEANGNALENQEKYEESYAGKLQKLQTEWQEFWLNLLNSDGFKKLLDALIVIVEAINKIGDSIGHLTVVIGGLGLGLLLSTAAKIGKQWIANTLALKAMGISASKAAKQYWELAAAEAAAAAAGKKNNLGLDDDFIDISDEIAASNASMESGAAGTAAISASTLAILLAIVAAITAAAIAWDNLTTTVDEARAKLEETESKIADIKSEINEINNLETKTDGQEKRLELLKKELELEERIKAAREQVVKDEKFGEKFSDRFDNDNYSTQIRNELEYYKKDSAKDIFSGFWPVWYDAFHHTMADTEDDLKKYTQKYHNIQNEIMSSDFDNYGDSKKESIIAKSKEIRDEYIKSVNEAELATLELEELILQMEKDGVDKNSDDYQYAVNKLQSLKSMVKAAQKDLNLYNFFDSDEFYEAINHDEEALKELINSEDNDAKIIDKLKVAYPDLLDLMDREGISADTLVDKYLELSNTREAAAEQVDKGYSKSEMIDAISNMTTGFDKLDEIYADIYDKGSFDFTKLASKGFTEAFEGLEKEYTEFIETVSAHPDDLAASQEAFNKLVGAYISSEKVLQELNEENKDLTINMLKNMGVANAKEVVEEALADKELQREFAERLLAKTSHDVTEATSDEINALIKEGNYADDAKVKIYNYALQKKFAAGVNIRNNDDINFLIELAEYAELAGDVVYETFQKIRSSYNTAKAFNDENPNGLTTKDNINVSYDLKTYEDAYTKATEDLWNKVKSKYATLVAPEVDYSGGDKTKDAIDKANKSGEESKEIFDWIEKALQRQEEEINRIDKVVNATYKNWSKRNSSLLSEITEINKEIAMQSTAYEAYMRDAEAIPLSEEYKKLVREGAMKSEIISDKTLKKNIKEYEELYDKAIKAKDAIADLEAKIAALAKTKFDNVKSEFEGFTSEIEHFVNMIDKELSHVENMEKIAGKSFYTAKMDQDEQRLEELNKERTALLQALREAEANGIEEGSADWIAMRNDIYSVDEAIADLTYEVEDLKKKLKEVAKLNFDDLKSQFENAISIITGQIDLTDSVVSMTQNAGYIASREYYKALIEGSKENVTGLRKEYETLSKTLADAMAAGDIEKYDKQWYEMNSDIMDVKKNLVDAANATIEYANALRQIDWDVFDRGLDRIKLLVDESEFFQELMSWDDKLKDDNGDWTNKGLVKQGLIAQDYQSYMDSANAYGAEAEEIRKLLETDPKNTVLIDRMHELLGLQRDSILAALKEKKALIDLVKEGYDALLEKIKKLIDEYKEALDSAKDYENSPLQYNCNVFPLIAGKPLETIDYNIRMKYA